MTSLCDAVLIHFQKWQKITSLSGEFLKFDSYFKKNFTNKPVINFGQISPHMMEILWKKIHTI